MPRMKKNRMVHQPPLFNSFKPTGIRRDEISSISLSLDEFEAIRLADYLGMEHLEASEEMEISRSTFTRLLDSARKKIALFLVEGRELSIEGGNIHFRRNFIQCFDCGHMFDIKIDDEISECPECGSRNLKNFAGGYGHGRCCKDEKIKRRRRRQ